MAAYWLGSSALRLFTDGNSMIDRLFAKLQHLRKKSIRENLLVLKRFS